MTGPFLNGFLSLGLGGSVCPHNSMKQEVSLEK